MRILHISDTHGYHHLLELPTQGIDLIIHTGDASTSRSPAINFNEFSEFLEWFSAYPSKYKIYVPGNHDISIANSMFDLKQITNSGINVLVNESITIEGINFYGTPYTPLFGDWSFMLTRGKMSRIWDQVPENTNVLLSHGAPKGILDSVDCDGNGKIFERVGCGSMKKCIDKHTNLQYVLFGHIHDNGEAINSGIFIKDQITYSNAAAVKDGRFGIIYNHGNIFQL